ncbi:hypothetical protein [Halobellus clavatus]|nr:hypothetical protein [Halobellus clavatus]
MTTMDDRPFPALLNQVTIAIIMSGFVLLLGLWPIYPVGSQITNFRISAVVISLLLSFFLGIIVYILTRTGEAVLVQRGVMKGHKEVFEEILRDPEKLSEESTKVFYSILESQYDTERENVKDNLADFYNLVLSTVLQSQYGLSQTLLGIYILSRGVLLVFPALIVIYAIFPTQYPSSTLSALCLGLLIVFFFGYQRFQKYYVQLLITDFVVTGNALADQ